MPADADSLALWPAIIYFGAVLALVVVMLGLSHVLGERRATVAQATREPFESGIVPAAPVQIRFSVRFYLMALFFVVFDVEAAYLFAWAVAFRESGWAGYWAVLIFVAILLATLAYLWRIGALDWRTDRQKAAAAGTKI